MNWIKEHQFDWRDADIMDRLGDTLCNLELTDVFNVKYSEDEVIEDGCGCGGCYETVYELYLYAMYDEVVFDEVLML